MKPLVLLGAPRPVGGACTEAGDTALLWRKMGLDVTVLPASPEPPSNPWPQRLKDAGCNVVAPLTNHTLPPWLKDAIVVDFQCRRAVEVWPELRRRGCKLVHLPTHNVTMEFEHATFRQWPPTAVVFESKFQMQTIGAQYSFYGVPSERQRMIHGAFDVEAFPYAPCPRPNGHFVVGCIARDDPKKWPRRLVSVLEAVRAKVPKLHGHFLGWTPAMLPHSGPLPPWIGHSAPGSIPARDFLSECHALLCLPTCLENWPRVTLEAMSSGVPIIAMKLGGFTEQLSDATAILVSNAQQAIDGLLRLATDEPYRLQLAESGRRSLDCLADPEAIGAAWKELLGILA